MAYAEASGPKHPTGRRGSTVSGVSIPISRDVLGAAAGAADDDGVAVDDADDGAGGERRSTAAGERPDGAGDAERDPDDGDSKTPDRAHATTVRAASVPRGSRGVAVP